MIPFLFIAGGAYLLFDALGDKRGGFDPLEEGFPTKGFRGYRKGASHYAKGGNVEFADPNKSSYYYKRYNGAIGAFAWKYQDKYNEGILYPISDFDKEYYNHLKLKSGEHLFRYSTDRMKGDKYLIKINIDKGLVYFMKDANKDDDKNPEFESRGVKAEYILLEKE